MLGDISGDMTFEGIVNEISDLADVVVDTALQQAIDKISKRFGAPDARITVLGMGKLGARELNYSSDIDLIRSTGVMNGSRATPNAIRTATCVVSPPRWCAFSTAITNSTTLSRRHAPAAAWRLGRTGLLL